MTVPGSGFALKKLGGTKGGSRVGWDYRWSVVCGRVYVCVLCMVDVVLPLLPILSLLILLSLITSPSIRTTYTRLTSPYDPFFPVYPDNPTSRILLLSIITLQHLLLLEVLLPTCYCFL